MDVFALARHEYLQPPVPKNSRQIQQQQQQQQQQSSISSQGGSTQQAQQAAFSTGLFGNMNQSSSS